MSREIPCKVRIELTQFLILLWHRKGQITAHDSSSSKTKLLSVTPLIYSIRYVHDLPHFPWEQIITQWNQSFFWPSAQCSLKSKNDNPSKKCKRKLMFLWAIKTAQTSSWGSDVRPNWPSTEAILGKWTMWHPEKSKQPESWQLRCQGFRMLVQK